MFFIFNKITGWNICIPLHDSAVVIVLKRVDNHIRIIVLFNFTVYDLQQIIFCKIVRINEQTILTLCLFYT